MKIVQLNKHATFFGGAETVIESITTLLEEVGHSVSVVGCSAKGKTPLTNAHAIGAFPRTVKEKWHMRKQVPAVVHAVQSLRPDLLIVHNIYFTFPYAKLMLGLKDLGIPIVQYGHDYNRTCPQRNHFRNGATCHSCTATNQIPLLRYNCLQNYAESFLAWWDFYTAKKRGAFSIPSIVFAPSTYAAKNLAHWGEKIPVVPLYNPIVRSQVVESLTRGEGALFVGQLTEEKGVRTFLALAQQHPTKEFKICGHGPLEELVKSSAKKNKNITYLGVLSQNEVQETMARAFCLVVPSLWEEVLGMVILEAMQVGTPVIGASSGAIPELLSEGRGFLFSPGNVEDALKELLKVYALTEEEYQNMGQINRTFLSQFSPQRYYENFKSELSKVGVVMESNNG